MREGKGKGGEAQVDFQSETTAKVISLDPVERTIEAVDAEFPDYDPELDEPETEGGESMEYITEPAEDIAPTIAPAAQPQAKRRQGVSRMLAEAVANNPGLTQSEYQRALGIKSPIATMAKRLVERGIISQKHDGRYVRYYPGKREFSEARTGRKPNTPAKSRTQAKQQPTEAQPQGWNIVSITYDDGNTKRYVRLDRQWYELVESGTPVV